MFSHLAIGPRHPDRKNRNPFCLALDQGIGLRLVVNQILSNIRGNDGPYGGFNCKSALLRGGKMAVREDILTQDRTNSRQRKKRFKREKKEEKT